MIIDISHYTGLTEEINALSVMGLDNIEIASYYLERIRQRHEEDSESDSVAISRDDIDLLLRLIES